VFGFFEEQLISTHLLLTLWVEFEVFRCHFHIVQNGLNTIFDIVRNLDVQFRQSIDELLQESIVKRVEVREKWRHSERY